MTMFGRNRLHLTRGGASFAALMLALTTGATVGVPGTNVAGAGLTNLAPEFGPDAARWFKHLFHR